MEVTSLLYLCVLFSCSSIVTVALPKRSGDFREEHRSLYIALLRDRASDISCEERCRTKFQKAVRRNGIAMVGGFGSIPFPAVFYKRSFDRMCALQNEHNSCVKTCKTTVEYNALDYLCFDHYKEFVSHFDCYRLVQPNLKSFCEWGFCRKFRPKQFPAEHLDFVKPRTRRLLSRQCETFKCHLECQMDTIVEYCQNKEPALFIRKFVAYLINEWRRSQREDAKKLGFVPMVPDSCVDLV